MKESLTAADPGRRAFIRKTTLGAATVAGLPGAKSYAAISGASSRVRIAVIGLKRRGLAHLRYLAHVPNVEVTWICEVDGKQMEKGLAEAQKQLGYKPKTATDIHEVIQKKDVDAVTLAIPDHWHAYGTMIAAKAGKHVYLEKPTSHNLAEDRFLIEFEKKHSNIVFQVGVQQRSSVESIEVMQAIHGGEIGDVYNATTFYINRRGEVPVPRQVEPPSYFNWELWQGPAPRRPFLDILEDYNWHWRWHWGTAESSNNGTHELDVARWALGVKFPSSVQSLGGKYHFKDDGWEMYDTMMATFTFPKGKLLQWDGKSRNAYETYGNGYDRGTIVYGSEGTVFVNREGYKLFDRSGKLVRERMGVARTEWGVTGDMAIDHMNNFVQAIRGNEKVTAPISEGAVSTHLANYINVASRTKISRLGIDPKTGEFRDKAVMDEYWGRDYEPGWELTL